jgi:hypothetical protein
VTVPVAALGDTVAVSVTPAPVAGFEFETVKVVDVAVVLPEPLEPIELLLHPEMTTEQNSASIATVEPRTHLSCMADPLPQRKLADFGIICRM